MPMPYNDVALLLRRAGFGASQTEISRLAQYDRARVVNEVVDAAVPALVYPSAEWRQEYPNEVANRQRDAVRLWYDRMATTTAPLAEKMVVFWHGHFTSSANNCQFRWMLDQWDLFRNGALGSMLELSQDVAVSTAMVHYLDNKSNTKAKPNENFARELLELFTLGVDQYTQADVVAAARAWTGHQLANYWGPYLFKAANHDTGNKTFFGVTKNWDGPDIITEVLTGQKRTVAARYLTRKLWAFFAQDAAPSAAVDAVATVYLNSQLNVRELLRAMFMRPEFYATAARQEHVRSPFDYVAATLKHSGLSAGVVRVESHVPAMGQRLYYPPNVAGWKVNGAWISTSNSWAKGNFARTVATEGVKAGLLSDITSVSVATSVQRALDRFGLSEVSANTRASLEQLVTAERAAGGANERLNLITATLLTPEYQAG